MRLWYCSGGRAKCGGGPYIGPRALVWGPLSYINIVWSDRRLEIRTLIFKSPHRSSNIFIFRV